MSLLKRLKEKQTQYTGGEAVATFYQQGDVLMHLVDEVPKGFDVEEGHGNVLAEGEVTGHAHRVRGDITMFARPGFGGPEAPERFMDVPKRITVTHEEHGPVELPKGTYKVEQVREYDYFSQQARRVYD